MDEADVAAAVDAVIAQMSRAIERGAGPRARLIRQCDMQLAVARHLQRLHEQGVIGRYTMPGVHMAGGDVATVHADFDYISEEERG